MQKNFNALLSWEGIVGQKPSFQHYQHFFNHKDVFLYMGHGLGTGHIKEKQFNTIIINSLMMFFGCSSISMIKQNSQMHGLPLTFMQNQCPAILGCLWDVTDKDTDLLTAQMFHRISTKNTIDFSECLQESKKLMKLPNINGAAVVIYGLPCKLEFK